MPAQIENEVKLYVPDLGAVEAALLRLGAELVAPRVLERNQRFEDNTRSLNVRGVVLRLRQDSRARLTYKEPCTWTHDGIGAQFEAEIEVDDFGTTELILKRLGFVPSVLYEKYRTTYHYDGAEIMLDEMPYGHFVEIEAESDVIRRVIAALGLDDAPRLTVNYITLFNRVKAALNLPFDELTFDAFRRITVPPDAITGG